MPTEYTSTARRTLGADRLLVVTQLCVLSHDREHTAELARTMAAAAIPNRRDLLRGRGHPSPDTLDDRLVDAIVAHGHAEDIAHRVQEHLDAGADHVSLHILTTEPHIPAHSSGSNSPRVSQPDQHTD